MTSTGYSPDMQRAIENLRLAKLRYNQAGVAREAWIAMRRPVIDAMDAATDSLIEAQSNLDLALDVEALENGATL